MRVRAQSPTGDMRFGQSGADFLVNSPAAVAQLVLTWLLLWQGSWFLDTTVGTPYATDVLGYGTKGVYDLAIQNQVLNTQGVTGISAYSSTLDTAARTLTVTMTIETQFGTAEPMTVVL